MVSLSHVKRLLCLVVVTAAALVLAAPALSLRPYHPQPLGFSVAAPDGSAGLAAPVRAPKRFNMVGLTWQGRAAPDIEIRTRREGGGWSPWAHLEAVSEDGPDPGREGDGRSVSTPVWVGSADWVQYRLTRAVRAPRLAFVNTRGDATAADRVRNRLRGIANAAVRFVAREGAANAADPKPAMVSRAAWGAEDCEPRSNPEYGTVRAAVVHHTVSLNDYSREEAPAVVLGICRFHRDVNKWNDLGYNFLVDRFGTIYEGRAGGADRAVIGAQAQGYNAQTTGIANIGDFTAAGQSPAALAALARLIRWKLPLAGAPTSGTASLVSAGGAMNRYPAGTQVRVPRVAGHRDLDSTACPGTALYAQMSELRRLVGVLGPSGISSRLSAGVAAASRTVTYGKRVRVRGSLSAAGTAATRQPVVLEARIGGRWRRVGSARTDSRGRWSVLIRPRRSRELRARFAARGLMAAATSRPFIVAMRPILKLTLTPKTGAAGFRVTVAGTVKPGLEHVHRVLQLRRGRAWETVGVKTLKVDRRGRYRSSFKPPSRGSYRYFAEARRSTANALARSRKVALRVTGARGGGAGAP